MYWVVKRPIATWMITIALFVFGLVSYQRLALNLMPDLNYPTITIRTEADGYAPEEVEEQVSRKLEEAVATTQGLSHLESRSRAGLSEILLSFHWDTTLDNSIQDVRERIQRVFLSADIKRPLILRYDPSLDPIIRIALSSSQSLSELREIADRLIKRDLEALDGIAAVRIQGGQEREIQVLAQEDWMAARGISIDNIIQTLASENVNMPAGSILEGDREYLVRTLNAFTDIDDLKSLKISRSDGVKIPITEVAHIQEGYKERSIISRLNAEEAVELEVYKSADANIVQITNQLKARLFDGEEALEGQLPSHIKLSILEDQASFIESAINNLKNTAFLGAFLAIIILFVFLRNFRATAIIGTAIPLSIVVTFAPMYIGGVSLNLMSLGGLALGIGMLVDNAVVVLENIQVHLDKGKSRQEAAAVGSSEVAMAVTASTLTTISVFLPITFVEGAAGQIFGDLSLAVVFSLLASLVIALFFVPMLAASEVRLPEASSLPPWRERFGSWQSFKKDFTEHNGFRKWIWLLWGIPRLANFFLFELIVTLCVYPCMILA
ncbi:MAG: efflux RND transporter permease subunit, partial [Myxococcota bacterium]|nr:efflux RND transporter permease subunit [Myxococcota bacterium]